MIERKKIVSSRIHLNLLHFHFLRPRGRKVIVDIQVTKFEIAPVLQPLCTVSEVIGIIQRSQAGDICDVFRFFRPADSVIQIPVGNIRVVSQRPVYAGSVQHHTIMGYSLKQSIHAKTFIFKSQINAIINLRYGSGISYRLLVIVVNHVIAIQISVLDITWTYFREFLHRTALYVRLISEITDSLPAKTLPDRVTFFRQIAIRLISLTIFYDFTFGIGEVGSDIIVEVLVFLFPHGREFRSFCFHFSCIHLRNSNPDCR